MILVKPRSAGKGSMDPGSRPWPGISEGQRPECLCSWAYRGVWPGGVMEVKYANSLCPVHRLALAGVRNVTTE